MFSGSGAIWLSPNRHDRPRSGVRRREANLEPPSIGARYLLCCLVAGALLANICPRGSGRSARKPLELLARVAFVGAGTGRAHGGSSDDGPLAAVDLPTAKGGSTRRCTATTRVTASSRSPSGCASSRWVMPAPPRRPPPPTLTPTTRTTTASGSSSPTAPPPLTGATTTTVSTVCGPVTPGGVYDDNGRRDVHLRRRRQAPNCAGHDVRLYRLRSACRQLALLRHSQPRRRGSNATLAGWS